MGPYYIIDFDSTFITLEGLDELATIALEHNSDKEKIVKQIADITRAGMNGEMPFDVSLEKRLSSFTATKDHIRDLINLLKNHITISVTEHKEFFNTNADHIYIISGGFQDYIIPVVSDFGIKANHVLANKFVYDSHGVIVGIDKTLLLSQEKGKVKQIKALALRGDVYMIGDGFTDYQVKESGLASIFFLFTENIERTLLVSKADNVVKSFDEIVYYNHT